MLEPTHTTHTIHIAYAKDKHGSYARAYVMIEGLRAKGHFTTGNADSFEEAKAIVMQKISRDYLNQGLRVPTEIVEHGRMAYLKANGYYF